MVVHVIFSLWVIYPQCDFSNALLQPYHDVLLRYDPLAGISSSGHAITTPFFFETCGYVGGQSNLKIAWRCQHRGGAHWRKSQARQVTVGNPPVETFAARIIILLELSVEQIKKDRWYF
jgi:hypothetical protein